MPKQLPFSRERSGKWFVSFSVDEPIEQWAPGPNECIGVDLGLKTVATIALDDGPCRKVPNPRIGRGRRAREDRLHRLLHRQRKGSNRRAKTLRDIARAKERAANRRRDHLHKLSTENVRESQAIAFEDLNVRGMTASAKGTAAKPGKNVRQKAGLNREILDVSFGEYRRQVEYKSRWHGRETVAVDRYAPTSKECSGCLMVNTGLTLKDRTWTCAGCGAVHDRDENAAKNIRRRGMQEMADGRRSDARTS